LLPYVEQDNLWRVTTAAFQTDRFPFDNPPHAGLATVVPLFLCPADGRLDAPQVVRNYLVAFTSYLGVEGTNQTSRDGLLYQDSAVRFTDITDGTGNTLLVGERPPSVDLLYGWWYTGAGQDSTGSADMVLGVRERNSAGSAYGGCPRGPYHFTPGNILNPCDAFHFWSPHGNGAHFLYGDGSVHFLSYAADPLLPALATRAGGEPVQPPD